MDTITFSTPSEVGAALRSDALIPPDPPTTLASGATADLRRDMARFSGPPLHRERRAAVDAAVARLASQDLVSEASRRSTMVLDGGIADAIAELAFIVPVETMAAALGVPEADVSIVRADVYEIAVVIGRQAPSKAEVDAAATRMRRRFERSDADSTAPISLLYQTHDATAALFAATLLASQTDSARRPALARTARVTTEATTIGATPLVAGTVVTLDLESSGFEFGEGPHACPGRALAEDIVTGMADAFERSDYELIPDAIAWHPDGRPMALPVRRVKQ